MVDSVRWWQLGPGDVAVAVSVSPLVLSVGHLVLAAAVPSLRPAPALGLAVAGGHVASRAPGPPLLGRVSLVVPGAAQTLLPPAAWTAVIQEITPCQLGPTCVSPPAGACWSSAACCLRWSRGLRRTQL